ncbi:MAG: SUMF1/EgtB/PvdO family nonheme iron enzyme, partial [Myxococcota bacterium]
MRRLPLLALPALAVLACDSEPETLPPVGSHLVYVDTDAIVKVEAGSTPNGLQEALFDRLELAILDENGEVLCSGCVREVEATTSLFAGGGASFSVVPPPGTTPIARVRLFRAASRVEGVLAPESVIEVVAELPVTPAEGTVESSIFLATETVGAPRGELAAPVVVTDGDPAASVGRFETTQVNSWAGAARVDCATEPTDGRSCVPGGAYWMGNPLVQGSDFPEAERQRLVVMSPFYLDQQEVTVGEFRSWAETQTGEVDVDLRSTDPEQAEFFCTYTAEPGDDEARPVNCVGFDAASAYCAAQGGSLPSEAQFEYASGALRSALFVWGTDELALCEGAVWGRGAQPGTTIASVGDGFCLDEGADVGPLA